MSMLIKAAFDEHAALISMLFKMALFFTTYITVELQAGMSTA